MQESVAGQIGYLLHVAVNSEVECEAKVQYLLNRKGIDVNAVNSVCCKAHRGVGTDIVRG